MPTKAESILGGILADEMGLGKTLEVLTCIQINQRTDHTAKLKLFQVESKKHSNNKKSELFECVCGDQPKEFQNNTSKKKNLKPDKCTYQSTICGVWTHPQCVNFSGVKEDFYCLTCQCDLPAIPSKCTLIITPFIISQQWIEEINKHSSKKLNILFYKGAKEGYVQPTDLANLDICLTTYDVLKVELAYTHAYEYASENQRPMRKPRRFTTVPCCLLNVEWWRICLDEAQMVII